MSKTAKIALLISGAFIILVVMVYLVWGGTIRMAYANYLFKHGKTYEALKIYEDMAVDAPKSPYVLHNRALGYYQQGNYQRAGEELQKANKALESERLNAERQKDLTNRYQYHSGDALFKLGLKAQSGQEQNLFGQAAQSFQSSIIANPKDQDAKYNYELAKLHQKNQIKSQNQPQPTPKPQPKQQKQAEDLLNMSKQDEKYPVPPPSGEAPVDKDW